MIRPKQTNHSFYRRQAAEERMVNHVLGTHIHVPRKLPKPQPQSLSPVEVLIRNLESAETEIAQLIERCQLDLLVMKLLNAPYYKK